MALIDQCKNCKYFLQHYVKTQTGRFLRVEYGHCINRKLSFDMPQKRKTTCTYWKNIHEQIKERRECVKNRLMGMADYIRQIAEILADDETYVE